MHISLKQSIRQNHKKAAQSADFRTPSSNADLDVVLDQLRARVYDNGGRDSNKENGQVDVFDPKTNFTLRASFGDNGAFDLEETQVRTEKSLGKTTTTTNTTYWSLEQGGDLIHTTVEKTHEKPNAFGSIFADEQTTSVADSYILPSATFDETVNPRSERTHDGLNQAEREDESWGIIFGDVS